MYFGLVLWHVGELMRGSVLRHTLHTDLGNGFHFLVRCGINKRNFSHENMLECPVLLHTLHCEESFVAELLVPAEVVWVSEAKV